MEESIEDVRPVIWLMDSEPTLVVSDQCGRDCSSWCLAAWRSLNAVVIKPDQVSSCLHRPASSALLFRRETRSALGAAHHRLWGSGPAYHDGLTKPHGGWPSQFGMPPSWIRRVRPAIAISMLEAYLGCFPRV